MDFLDAFSTLFGYIAASGFSLWTLIHFYDLILLSGKLQEIRRTESMIAFSKLDLKSKIGSRIKKINNSTSLPIEMRNDISVFYSRMANLSFSSMTHYQELFDELRAVMPLLDLTPMGEVETINKKSANADIQNVEIATFDHNFKNPYFWEKLYKYETRIVRAVYAIAVLTTEQRALIEQYNHHLRTKNRQLPMPPQLEFEHFELLWKVIVDEDKAATAAAVIVDPVIIPTEAA